MSERSSCWKLWYEKPASRWEEALPIGNGRLGGMVFGRPYEERIQLNEDTLWSGYPRESVRRDAKRHLKEARALIFAGHYTEAERLIESRMLSRDTDAYLPLGDAYFRLDRTDEVQKYVRELDLDTGIATTRFHSGNLRFVREVFVSAPDQVWVVRLRSENGAPFSP